MPQGVELQSAPAQRGELGHLDLSRIAQDLQIRKVQVEAVVQLLDEGNTIPFITRYRKERTGGLDEEVLRTIQDRVGLLRQLADRKQTILRSIDGQGKLTDELRAAILAADNPKRLEDLYLPYKPKKRSLATAAREKGLEKLAMAIWERDPVVANLAEVLADADQPGAGTDHPRGRSPGCRSTSWPNWSPRPPTSAPSSGAVLWDTGKLCTGKSEKLAEGQGLDYKDYFQFQEPIRQIPPHRVLAINRGEKENALTVKIEWDDRDRPARRPGALAAAAEGRTRTARGAAPPSEGAAAEGAARAADGGRRRSRRAAPAIRAASRASRPSAAAQSHGRPGKAIPTASSSRRSPTTLWLGCWCPAWNARFVGN